MWKGLPVHIVALDAFYMDVNEVTVGRFRQFIQQSRYDYGGNWLDVDKYSPTVNHPMIYVTWYDAVAYTKWANKRLPTEAKSKYAARDGLIGSSIHGLTLKVLHENMRITTVLVARTDGVNLPHQ